MGAAGTGTAWGAWDKYMTTRTGVVNPDSTEKKLGSDIGAAISKSATSYKPKFNFHTEVSSSTFKLQHVDAKVCAGSTSPAGPICVQSSCCTEATASLL